MVRSHDSFRSKQPLTMADYEVLRRAFPGVFKDVSEFIDFVSTEQDKADRPDVYELKRPKPIARQHKRSIVYGSGRA